MTVTVPLLESMAAAVLHLMDDPQAFERPIPPCSAAAHEWFIAHDWKVTEQFSFATITSTHRVAIVCANCAAYLAME